MTRPVKELKAFKRIFLKNGESTTVKFEVTSDMLKCFGAGGKWSVEPGEYTILTGNSSQDVDLKSTTLTVE